MDATELSKTLRESARSNGLCDQWYNEWKDSCSPKELADKMFKGLDFVLKLHWPSNDFIKEHFNLDFRREVNVVVDDRHSTLNPKQSLILGKSEVTARFNGASHGSIYVRDNSRLTLTAKNRSFVIIHLYDNATVSIKQFDKAQIVVIKHSHDVTVNADESIRVREEYDYLDK